jgi:hypothetical protein
MKLIIHVFSFIIFLFENFIENFNVFYFVNLENTTLIKNIYTKKFKLKFDFRIWVINSNMIFLLHLIYLIFSFKYVFLFSEFQMSKH